MSGLTIPVEFNGHVFVPLVEVFLPEGTRCVAHAPALAPPPPVTPDHERAWAELCRQLDASTPAYPTVEEAMAVARGRP